MVLPTESIREAEHLDVSYGSDMASYLVRFVANLDPNTGESTDLYWPQYDAATNQTMLEFGWTGDTGADDRYISCRGDGIFDECDVGGSVVTGGIEGGCRHCYFPLGIVE